MMINKSLIATCFFAGCMAVMPSISLAHNDRDNDNERDNDKKSHFKNCEDGDVRIGMKHQGGIVFFVENPDRKGCGTHGLIEATKDLLADGWARSSVPTYAFADGLYAGEKNTTAVYAIVADIPLLSRAIEVAYNYKATADGVPGCADVNAICYGDWYLPSVYELKLLSNAYIEKGVGVGLSLGLYFSSNESETQTNRALTVDLTTGVVAPSVKTVFRNVIPVRKF